MVVRCFSVSRATVGKTGTHGCVFVRFAARGVPQGVGARRLHDRRIAVNAAPSVRSASRRRLQRRQPPSGGCPSTTGGCSARTATCPLSMCSIGGRRTSEEYSDAGANKLRSSPGGVTRVSAVLRTAGRHHSSPDTQPGQDDELEQEIDGQPEDEDSGSLQQRQHAAHAAPPSRSTAWLSRIVASRATSAMAGLSPTMPKAASGFIASTVLVPSPLS